MKYENDPIEKIREHFSIHVAALNKHDGPMYIDYLRQRKGEHYVLRKPTKVVLTPSGARGGDLKYVKELLEREGFCWYKGYYIPTTDSTTIRELRLCILLPCELL